MTTSAFEWLEDTATGEMRFAFRFDGPTGYHQGVPVDAIGGWVRIANIPEIGPLVVPRSVHEEVCLNLGHAVDILTKRVTLHRAFAFRFADNGGLVAWVTVGSGPEMGPYFPSQAEALEVGTLLMKALVLLLESEERTFPPA